MPINKLALIRYKTIDSCLQNRFRKWTLDDLTEAVAEALYEYEGITKGISKRTIQLDLQNMRSEKLGYNAPIVVTDKKFYTYSDRSYSITNIPLTTQDLTTLSEVVQILKQFKGFTYFEELASMVTRLEDKLYKQQHAGQSFIDFEKNELLKGLEFIDPIHRSIIREEVLEITYKSFRARQSSTLVFYPYLLKEYRNRWFILGIQKEKKGMMNLALDRIEAIKKLDEKYVRPSFDPKSYYHDVLGVTKNEGQRPQLIVMKIDKKHAPYVITKPLHHTQKILKETNDWIFFSICVIWNFELERELLGFGEYLKVLSPRRLQNMIKQRLNKTLEVYSERD